MRIAYICGDNGIPVFGHKGAAIHVRELSQALHDAGHEVAVFACRLGGERPAGYEVPVHELALDRPERAMLAAIGDDPDAGEPVRKEIRAVLTAATFRLRALPLLEAFRPDVIYERYSLLGTAGGDLARTLGVPHLLEVNAPLSAEHAAHRGMAWPQAARATERRIRTGADHVITVSAPLRDWAIRLGVGADRVTAIANGVDVARFAGADGTAVRARLGFGDAPVIGFTGTLRGWHGTPTLVRAFAGLVGRLRAGGTGAAMPRLLIVGDGPQRAEIEAIAERAGVGELVTITGMVPHATVPEYVAAMDVAVAPYDPSADFYFSPLKLYEYLAAGRPVVAARIGQIAEAVRDGETGLLYTPGDTADLTMALASLLDNDRLRGRLGTAGAQAARAHGWDRVADRIVALAGQTIAGDRRATGDPVRLVGGSGEAVAGG